VSANGEPCQALRTSGTPPSQPVEGPGLDSVKQTRHVGKNSHLRARGRAQRETRTHCLTRPLLPEGHRCAQDCCIVVPKQHNAHRATVLHRPSQGPSLNSSTTCTAIALGWPSPVVVQFGTVYCGAMGLGVPLGPDNLSATSSCGSLLLLMLCGTPDAFAPPLATVRWSYSYCTRLTNPLAA
jgi:hypothetical protein